MSRPRTPPLARLALCLGVLGPLGCATTPTEDEVLAQDAEELDMAGLTASGGWQSAPWSGPWIRLPGISEITVPHGLGRVPDEIHVYLSFVENDEGDMQTREFFPAAGDVANIRAVTGESIIVHNTTRGHYYMRIVLE